MKKMNIKSVYSLEKLKIDKKIHKILTCFTS